MSGLARRAGEIVDGFTKDGMASTMPGRLLEVVDATQSLQRAHWRAVASNQRVRGGGAATGVKEQKQRERGQAAAQGVDLAIARALEALSTVTATPSSFSSSSSNAPSSAGRRQGSAGDEERHNAGSSDAQLSLPSRAAAPAPE